MRITILIAAFAAGCGGKGTDLEGIYTVDAWNANSTSCADPGPSVLADHDPFLFVNLDSLFGHDYLGVGECPDVATCATAPEEESDLYASYFLDQGSDSKGWTGTLSYAFAPDANNNCTGGVTNWTLTVDGNGLGVTVRTEDIDVPSFPPRNGECEPDDAVEASEGLPCTGLEVVHATFTAEF